jgi:hypothetical protein
MMAMSVRINSSWSALFPWHIPPFACDEPDEHPSLLTPRSRGSALLNNIFFVRTFDLALGDGLGA